MQVAEALMTAEQFGKMPDDGKKYELVEGVPVEVCRLKPIHGRIQLRIGGPIMAYVDTNDLGLATAESGYVTKRDPDNVRGPDVAFISKARLGDQDLTEFIKITPDLAVEIVSDSDSPTTINTKVNEYLAAGSRVVWVFYPETKSVTVYNDDGHFYHLKEDGILDGGDLLPGFTLKLADVFKR